MLSRVTHCGLYWIRLLAVLVFFSGEQVHAAEPLPALPQYQIDIKIDTAKHIAHLIQRVTWTNSTRTPANHLAFNFYPHYRVPQGDYIHLAKTLELLRLQPSLGIERSGRFGVIKEARLLSHAGVACETRLNFEFDTDNPTALRFPLPQSLNPGETVVVELVCEFHIPNKQGRLGHWKGVTYITNALPMLAFCDDTGWQTKPFVPWHQPWFNEAGVFTATITLPENECLAMPAKVKSERVLPNGQKQIETHPFVGRDFALLCSTRYREFKGQTRLPDGRLVDLRCLAFPEHEFYANEIIKIVADAIPIYSRWFGPFPYDSFTIAESYFGWNGNECAGLIMIDERVFGMPELARGYVEYLVSHETCHQWWYNLVGTNGYSEPFMDEGAAAYFTHRLIDQTRGKNNEFLVWPKGLGWLPNIKRENYRYGSMYYAIRNGDMHPAAQDLPQYKHLFGLFTGAYDRGSKAFGMIENQLGEAAFLDFTRMLVAKYSWRVLQAKELRAELEAYTGRDWGEFFDRWIYGKGLVDWEVKKVEVEHEFPFLVRKIPITGPISRNRIEITLRQKGEFTEPTSLGVRLAGADGFPIRIPIVPAAGAIAGKAAATADGIPDFEYQVEPQANGTVKVTFSTLAEPEQIVVDPDNILLDANPGNNAWKSMPGTRITPLYTTLDETDVTSDYDRCNFTAGPWIWGASYQDPWYTRSTMIGLRAGANHPQRFRAGAYAGFRTDYRDAVVGADAVFLGDHLEAGLNWERRVGGPWGGQEGASGPNRAVAYLRHVLKPGSSMYLPPIMYQDGFVSYQDNFLPFPRSTAGQRYERLALGGYHFRLNLLTPYWDPESGVWVDTMLGGGSADFNGWRGMGEGRLELAAVNRLPVCDGPLRDVRLAGRFVGMMAWPDFGQFYALGGGTLFRGFDLAERQGSALWVVNAEIRWPIAQEVVWDCLDHTIGVRNVRLATFYDVGGVYANQQIVQDVAHAVGAGLRIDIAIFSFIERATLRFDAAKTLNANTPWQFWFGVQNAF